MIDGRKIKVHSIEELILVLSPVRASAIHSGQVEAVLPELRQMKRNVSAVLSFTSSQVEEMAHNSEFRCLIDEVRRECLLTNGMISRAIFRQRWLFLLKQGRQCLRYIGPL